MENGPPGPGHGERGRTPWSGRAPRGWAADWAAERAAEQAARRAEKVARRAEKIAQRAQRFAERRGRWARGDGQHGPHAPHPPNRPHEPHRPHRAHRPHGASPFGGPFAAPGDDCGGPFTPPRPGRRQRRVNGPWAMHQLEESDRGPGPAFVAGVAQVLGPSLAGAPVPPIGYALLLLGPFALVVGRRHPAAVLLVTVASTVAYEVAGFPGAPTFIAALIALVRAVRAGRRREARLTLLAGFVAFAVVGHLTGEVSWAHAAAMGAWTLVAYGFAEANRARLAQMVAIAKAQAEEERAVAERERAAEEQKRRQAADERLRIARELHDVLGHHLSLINVQAGVGLHLLDEHPEQAKTALAAIKQASSEALGEVRGVLAALRPEGEAAPKAPAPGLAEVEELTAAAGLPVAVKIEGTREQLPPDVDRAAYRIVQEALTNVRRHAGPAAEAELTLVYSPERLRVRVVNTGTLDPQARPDKGNGIAGMRERATAFGGTLRAGPRAEGGFEVVADLPVRAAT